MSNSLDPDQTRHSAGPDLVPNCLQKLSADDTRMQSVNVFSFSKKGELLASRNDFKMNTCCIHPMGTLLLDLSYLPLLEAANTIMESVTENGTGRSIVPDKETF